MAAGARASCRALHDVMQKDAGPAARSCSTFACAQRSFERREPFTLCQSGLSMDSFLESGVAGLANGNLLIYAYDSMGPDTRGLCLRPNISFAADDWPRCSIALAGLIDLRTGQPFKEPVGSSEQPWPASCAADALNAATAGIQFRLIAAQNVLPDYEHWGVGCKDAVSFEMLIGKNGRPKCARVRAVGLRPRNDALYDVIRSRLMRWRFEPPTLHGRPVELRWGMQINPMRKGDAPLPGPQIYPFCP
jgi:hypothetical protein